MTTVIDFCMFVFYVFWKCNIERKSYVDIMITSKDIFGKGIADFSTVASSFEPFTLIMKKY